MKTVILGALLLIGSAVDFHGQPSAKDTVEAERLWEQLVEVRGGRKKLHGISNMFVASGSGDSVRYRLYVYPQRYWEWNRAPKFHDFFFAMTGNLDLGWYRTADKTGLISDRRFPPVTGGADYRNDWLTDACIFFLETKWLQPKPLRVTRRTLGREQLDMLETTLADGALLNYYIEPESLIVRGAALHSSTSDKVPRFHVFDSYTTVEGISVPKAFAVLLDIKPAKKSAMVPLTFQFNVDYDETLFERPPSFAAGPDAWRRWK